MYCKNPLKLPIGIQNWFDLEKLGLKTDNYIQKKKIVISDCDGVITDSKSIYGAEGKLYKSYGAYDKEAMEILSKYGWKFFFITDDKSGLDITMARLSHLFKSFPLNLQYGNVSRDDRVKLVNDYVEDGYCVLFIGDSLSDIASMNIATYAGCPNNSPQIVKEYCHFISQSNGSEGGFADILLEAHQVLKEI